MITTEKRSTYGLQKATWTAVEQALQRLGATQARPTKKHGMLFYRLPNRRMIAVGRREAREKYVARSRLKALLHEIREAGVDPLLFLALLDGQDCAWYKRPEEVDRLAHQLQETARDLRVPREWRRVMQDFQRHEQAHEQPAPSETPPQVAPTKERYSVGDVIELTGLPSVQHGRARNYVNKAMHKRRGLAGDLIHQGHAWADQLPSRRRHRYFFTEQGAVAMAEHLVRKYGSPGQQPHAPVPRAGSVTTEVNLDEQPPAGADVLYVAQYHGVEPAWDGVTLDVTRIMQRIARKLRSEQEE